jgi:hypothetical protein
MKPFFLFQLQHMGRLIQLVFAPNVTPKGLLASTARSEHVPLGLLVLSGQATHHCQIPPNLLNTSREDARYANHIRATCLRRWPALNYPGGC